MSSIELVTILMGVLIITGQAIIWNQVRKLDLLIDLQFIEQKKANDSFQVRQPVRKRKKETE